MLEAYRGLRPSQNHEGREHSRMVYNRATRAHNASFRCVAPGAHGSRSTKLRWGRRALYSATVGLAPPHCSGSAVSHTGSFAVLRTDPTTANQYSPWLGKDISHLCRDQRCNRSDPQLSFPYLRRYQHTVGNSILWRNLSLFSFYGDAPHV